MDDLAETEPTTNGSMPKDADELTPAAAPASLADPDDPALSTLVRADGRRRRRTALLVIVAAVLAGAAGMWIGSRIQSPAVFHCWRVTRRLGPA